MFNYENEKNNTEINENLIHAMKYLSQRKKFDSLHEKNGLAFNITKQILELYIHLKFEKIQLAISKTNLLAEFNSYDFNGQKDYTYADLCDSMDFAYNLLFCKSALEELCESKKNQYTLAILLWIDENIDNLIKTKDDPIYSCYYIYGYILDACYRKNMLNEDVMNLLALQKTAFFKYKNKAISILSQLIFGNEAKVLTDEDMN